MYVFRLSMCLRLEVSVYHRWLYAKAVGDVLYFYSWLWAGSSAPVHFSYRICCLDLSLSDLCTLAPNRSEVIINYFSSFQWFLCLYFLKFWQLWSFCPWFYTTQLFIQKLFCIFYPVFLCIWKSAGRFSRVSVICHIARSFTPIPLQNSADIYPSSGYFICS